MPAIGQSRRHLFDRSAEDLGHSADCAEDLQYLLSVIFETYIARHGLRYQQLNDIMGALSGAEKEFFEHVVSPYEAHAREKNGPYYSEVKKMMREINKSSKIIKHGSNSDRLIF